VIGPDEPVKLISIGYPSLAAAPLRRITGSYAEGTGSGRTDKQPTHHSGDPTSATTNDRVITKASLFTGGFLFGWFGSWGRIGDIFE